MSLRDEVVKILREERLAVVAADRIAELVERDKSKLEMECASLLQLVLDMANAYLEVRRNGTFYNSPLAYRVNEALGINASAPCPEEGQAERDEAAEYVDILRVMAHKGYSFHIDNSRFKSLQWALRELERAGVIPKPRTVMRIEIDGPVPSGSLFLCYGEPAQYREILKSEVDNA